MHGSAPAGYYVQYDAHSRDNTIELISFYPNTGSGVVFMGLTFIIMFKRFSWYKTISRVTMTAVLASL